MIDLHTHSLFSDGELIPAELIRRAIIKGYRYLAITDHVDYSNYRSVIHSVRSAIEKMKNFFTDITLLAGVEITHVPPPLIPELIQACRKEGAQVVVIHGETIVEPVAPGTNRAAIEGEADILAHPGLISEEDVKLAAEKGIRLEITTRSGHSYTNGHVVKMAKKYGAKMIIDTDSHSPYDLVSRELATKIAMGAGLDEEEVNTIFEETEKWINEELIRR